MKKSVILLVFLISICSYSQNKWDFVTPENTVEFLGIYFRDQIVIKIIRGSNQEIDFELSFDDESKNAPESIKFSEIVKEVPLGGGAAVVKIEYDNPGSPTAVIFKTNITTYKYSLLKSNGKLKIAIADKVEIMRAFLHLFDIVKGNEDSSSFFK